MAVKIYKTVSNTYLINHTKNLSSKFILLGYVNQQPITIKQTAYFIKMPPAIIF